jgi:translocation and assembly module TamB
MLLVLGTLAILGSQPGLRLLQWLVEQQLPSVQMSPVEGSLWRGFRIADIRLMPGGDLPPIAATPDRPATKTSTERRDAIAPTNGPALASPASTDINQTIPDHQPWLHIKGLALKLDIYCFWSKTLCVDSFTVDAVQLDDTRARPDFLNSSSSAAPTSPLQLPMQWRYIAINKISLHTADVRLELDELSTTVEFASLASKSTTATAQPFAAVEIPPQMQWHIGATTLNNLRLFTPRQSASGHNTAAKKPTTAASAELAVLQQFQRWLDDPAQQLPLAMDVNSLSIDTLQWQQVSHWPTFSQEQEQQRQAQQNAEHASPAGNAKHTTVATKAPAAKATDAAQHHRLAGLWQDIALHIVLQPRQLQIQQLTLRQLQLLDQHQPITLTGEFLLQAPHTQQDEGQLQLQLQIAASDSDQAPAFSWQLQSQGPLHHIKLQSNLHATLPNQVVVKNKPTNMAAEAQATTAAQVNATASPTTIDITSQGELDLRAAKLHLQLTHTIPKLQLPWVHWQDIDVALEGDLEQLSTRLRSEFTTEKGISGQLSLQGTFAPFAQQWAVDQLRIHTLNGEITAEVQLDLAKQQLQSQWQFLQLRPGFYLGDDSARLNGTVVLDVDLSKAALSLPSIALEGVLYQQPIQMNGDLSLQLTDGITAQSIKSRQLVLQHGPNRLDLQGEFNSEWALQGSLSVTDLALTMPQAEGQLSATFSLSGHERSPDVKLHLSAAELNYQDDYQFKNLKLDMDIHALGQAPSALTLQLGASQAPDLQLKQLVFEITGTRAAHESHLLLESHQLNAVMRQSGQWSDVDWRSQWQSMRIASDFGDWQLSEPIETILHLTGRHPASATGKTSAKTTKKATGQKTTTTARSAWQLQLPAHCWTQITTLDKSSPQQKVQAQVVAAPNQADTTELCLSATTLLSKAQGELALVLRYIDLAALSPLLPNTHNLQGRADADVMLAWQHGKLRQATLDATLRKGAYQYQSLRELKIPWHHASLHIGLSPQQLDADVNLQFTQTAHLNSRMTIMQPGQPNATIAADVKLDNIDLAFLHPFLNEYSHFKGSAAGDLRVQGDLYRPAVYGELTVTDSDLIGNEAPVTLEKSSVTLAFDGFSATLRSQLTTPEGPIALSGRADWHQLPWYAKLQLQSSGFKLHHSSGTLQVAPDLTAEITPFAQSLVGKINIPSGQIKVNQLPESATGVSADEVILNADGTEANVAAGPQSVQADIRLILGDKVKIAGFGLQSQLQGELRYRQQNQQKMLHGQMQLKKGTFTALGQDLQIRKGVLTFNGPLTNPLLTVDAIRNPARTEDNVIAGLRIHGLADNPQVQVFSEPSKPQANAFAYLLMGRDLNPSNNSDNMLAGSLINLGIGQSSNLVGKVGNLVGVEDLNVDTSGSGDKAKVEISGYLSPRLQVKYGVGIFDKFGEFTARYRIGQNLYIEAVQGLDSALDLLYKFEFD